jgi:hypothetical protein
MSEKNVEEVEEVVDGEFSEVEESETPRCVVTVGMKDDGSVFFTLDGTEQSLINIEGLLKYAEKHMELVWKDRLGATEGAK